MLATVTILFLAKFFKMVSFPDLGRETLRKIWPLPLMWAFPHKIWLFNIVIWSGTWVTWFLDWGALKNFLCLWWPSWGGWLFLPFWISKIFFFNQVLNTHDHDRRVLHLKGVLILPLNHEHWPLILRVCSATPTCSLNMYVSLSQRIFNNILDYHIILDTTHHGSPVVRLSDDLWLRTRSCQWSRLQFKRVKHSWWF